MNIIPRTSWQDPNMRVTGPAMQRGRIDTQPAHYTAAATIPSDIPSYLRAMQRDYVVNRGYSLGYNFAIDQTGQAWEIRGLDIQCAANKGWNERTVAILCLVNGADAMNSRMVSTYQQLGAHIQSVIGRRLNIVGHQDIGSTACPGAGVQGQVRSGVLAPSAGPPPPDPTPPTEDDTMQGVFESQTNPREFNAMFFGTCDAQGRTIELQWSGNGDDPRVQERVGVMKANFQTFPLLLAGVRNNRLHPKHQPSDIVDSLHVWTDADFAP